MTVFRERRWVTTCEKGSIVILAGDCDLDRLCGAATPTITGNNIDAIDIVFCGAVGVDWVFKVWRAGKGQQSISSKTEQAAILSVGLKLKTDGVSICVTGGSCIKPVTGVLCYCDGGSTGKDGKGFVATVRDLDGERL